jgi:threonine/homoserine/homoserine lactone efflux protein
VHEALRTILYALVAAVSPTALVATLAVLASKRGRVNGIVFMVGFLLTQSIILVGAYVLGSTASRTEHRTVNAYLELAAGLGLVALTLIKARRQQPQAASQTSRAFRTSPRVEAMIERLSRVTPSVSLGIGALMGVGTKRLIITIIAAGTIAMAGWSDPSPVWLGVLYVILATVIVWLPVVYSAILGKRADQLVAKARARTEGRGRGRRFSFIAGLVLGGLLIIDALGRLLG